MMSRLSSRIGVSEEAFLLAFDAACRWRRHRSDAGLEVSWLR
jgi:uncharacterized protein (UPF0548 family)